MLDLVKRYPQRAGYLGYYGISLDSDYNNRVAVANLVVDEYNKNVSTYKTSQMQMDYQKLMLRKINSILNDK